MKEQEDFSTAEEVMKEFKELPKSEKNKFISQIISSQNDSVIKHYFDNLKTVRSAYQETLANANVLVTKSLESVGEQVLDIVYQTLPQVLQKLMQSRVSSAKNIDHVFKVGEQRMIEITGEQAIIQSLLMSNAVTPEHIMDLGDKSKRFLEEKDKFQKLVEETNFKLILEQNTLRSQIFPLLTKSIHVLNDEKNDEEEKEIVANSINLSLTNYTSCPYILNVRAHTPIITKFDFVKQRLIEKAICVPGQEDSLFKCPSSSSVICIQRKWLLCGGKYHPSQRINTVLMLDEDFKIEVKAPMGQSRAGVSLANINNEEVLASGGCGNSNKPLIFSEIYTVSTDSWRKINPMLQARSNHASLQVGADSVFIFCGYSTQQKVKSVEMYSLSENKWAMVEVNFKGNDAIWICRDFIRAFMNKQGQIVIFGEYNGGDHTFILEESPEESEKNQKLRLVSVQKNDEGYPPIGGYYSGACFYGGNLFTFDDNNILWMFEDGQWISII